MQARDLGNNLSPFSAPVTITTAAPNSVDTTPPTTPENLTLTDLGCGQVLLTWTQSTDDFDDPPEIRYDIYVEGFFDHSVVGVGSTIAVGGQHWISVFDVVAVDTSGNQSRVATADIILGPCP